MSEEIDDIVTIELRREHVAYCATSTHMLWQDMSCTIPATSFREACREALDEYPFDSKSVKVHLLLSEVQTFASAKYVLWQVYPSADRPATRFRDACQRVLYESMSLYDRWAYDMSLFCISPGDPRRKGCGYLELRKAKFLASAPKMLHALLKELNRFGKPAPHIAEAIRAALPEDVACELLGSEG